MSQMTLFDAPLHRATDPNTSREAAADVAPKRGVLQQRFVEAVRELGEATASEAASLAVQHHGGLCESVRKRATEALRLGLVEVAGERPCAISGKPCTTYRVKS